MLLGVLKCCYMYYVCVFSRAVTNLTDQNIYGFKKHKIRDVPLGGLLIFCLIYWYGS